MSSAADDFKMKNSFVVKFGVGLWLTSMGITGFWAMPAGWILGIILGSFLDLGILEIDLSITSINVAIQDDTYKELAIKAYQQAIARVYTEEEKIAIRKQYQDALRDFASVGSRMPDQPDS